MKTGIEKIYHSALKFLMPLTTVKTYEMIVREAMQLVNAKYGSIFLPTDDGFERAYASNQKLYRLKARKDGNTHKVYEKREPFLHHIDKIVTYNPGMVRLHIESDISIPLAYADTTIGVLSVLSPSGRPFTNDDLHSLTLFAPLATLALRKTMLYDEINDAVHARDLFISLAAHELKTPLTSIQAYTQLISKALPHDESPPRVYTEKLLTEEKRLKRLVDELLEIGRIQTGNLKFTLKKTDLASIVIHAQVQFQHIYPKIQIFLHFPDHTRDLLVLADEDKLLQALVNILNNAGKFSKPGSTISMHCAFDDRYITITVEDHGSGIAKNDLSRIFDRFYRGKHTKQEGMGLGLYLVKQIIDKHNGHIHIHSVVNKGTTVIISLPTYTTNGT